MHLSSFLFVVPVVVALVEHQFFLAVLISFLLFTSIGYHWSQSKWFHTMDRYYARFMVASCVGTSILLFLLRPSLFLLLSSLLGTSIIIVFLLFSHLKTKKLPSGAHALIHLLGAAALVFLVMGSVSQ